MRIDALIKMLEKVQTELGPDAQIDVPEFNRFDTCREEIYMDISPIWTVLASRGKIVEW